MNTVPKWLERVRANEPFEMIDFEFLDSIFAAQRKVHLIAQQALADPMGLQPLFADLLGYMGKDVIIAPPVFVDVGFNIEVGDNTFINTNVTLLDTYPIRIGRNVMMGPNCAIYPAGHPVRASDRIRRDADGNAIGQITSGAAITIEDEVWLGGNVIVLPGVTIGARTTIGAGSVVTKSIPPDVFAAGNPCRVIRQL